MPSGLDNEGEEWRLVVGSLRDYLWDCKGLRAVESPEAQDRSSLCTRYHPLLWVGRLSFTWQSGVSSCLLLSPWLSMLIKKSVVLKVRKVQGGQFAVKRDFSAGGKRRADTICVWSYTSEERTVKVTWCLLHQYSADCLKMINCAKPYAAIRADNQSRQAEGQEW